MPKKFFPVEHHFSKTRFYEIMRHRVTRAVASGKITEKKKTEIMRNLKDVWESFVEADDSMDRQQMARSTDLRTAFYWDKTTQGAAYWADVEYSLTRKQK